MDRRKAIKNIALAFGCTVATPTLLNVVTACTDSSVATNYLFLSKSEAELVERLTETIMPKMHFPLVETMNLTVFVDQMFYHTENDKSKENFRKGSKAFENELSLNHNKEVNKISNEDFKTTFKTYFNPEKEDAVFSLLNNDFDTLSPDKKKDFSMYTFLTKVRYYCLFGYATSEAFSVATDF